jgi:hypothetical protein
MLHPDSAMAARFGSSQVVTGMPALTQHDQDGGKQ